MPTLFSNEHLEVVADELRRVVRVIRTAQPYATVEQAVRSFREAKRVSDALERGRYALLLDMRLAPGRNDPDFEAAMAAPRRDLFSAFPRRAVLVRTSIGRMQIARISHEEGREDVEIFQDEAEALTYLGRR